MACGYGVDFVFFLDDAFDQYVIQGVTHNIGFGKSILANDAYWTGDYSTAFIPTFYPDGFSGDNLNTEDHNLLSVVAHNIKNIHLAQASRGAKDIMYVTI